MKITTVNKDGREIESFEINVFNCPHRIFVAKHYNEDGSCKCNDPNEKVMKHWGYRWKDGQWH